MNSYNGFSGAQRSAAQRWLNVQWASGLLEKPKLCCACGQDVGVIDAHAEDYSLPFAAGKTDEFHLCFPCHIALHCRFRNAQAWDNYLALVAAGGRTQPFFSRNFPLFISRYFGAPQLPLQTIQEHWIIGDTPARLVLNEIDGWLLAHTGKGWR